MKLLFAASKVVSINTRGLVLNYRQWFFYFHLFFSSRSLLEEILFQSSRKTLSKGILVVLDYAFLKFEGLILFFLIDLGKYCEHCSHGCSKAFRSGAYLVNLRPGCMFYCLQWCYSECRLISFLVFLFFHRFMRFFCKEWMKKFQSYYLLYSGCYCGFWI